MSDSTTKIPKSQWGVHEHHCCKNHGCKYGDSDCPVVLGLTNYYNCEEDQPSDPCFGERAINELPLNGKYYTPTDIEALEIIAKAYGLLVSESPIEGDAKTFPGFKKHYSDTLLSLFREEFAPSDTDTQNAEIIKRLLKEGYRIIKIK